MLKPTSSTTRLSIKHRHILAVAGSLAGTIPAELIDSCLELVLLRHVPPTVKEKADQYASMIVEKLRREIETCDPPDGVLNPTQIRLRPEVMFALNTASQFGKVKMSRSEAIFAAIDEGLLEVVREIVSKRLQIGDTATAMAFRKSVINGRTRATPTRVPKALKPVEVDARRWLKLMAFIGNSGAPSPIESTGSCISPIGNGTKRHDGKGKVAFKRKFA